MAFKSAVLPNNPDLPAGEVIKASPYNVSVFELFEDGLIEGRFCQFASGSINNLNASAAPIVAGVVRRKITGEVGTGIYSTTGAEVDNVAEVINFGFATVTVTDAAAPARLDPVYAINLDTAERGKATQDSAATGAEALEDVVFWEQKTAKVWLVRISKYL